MYLPNMTCPWRRLTLDVKPLCKYYMDQTFHTPSKNRQSDVILKASKRVAYNPKRSFAFSHHGSLISNDSKENRTRHYSSALLATQQCKTNVKTCTIVQTRDLKNYILSHVGSQSRHKEISRRYSSALYITSDKLSHMYGVVSPNYDIETILNNQSIITEHLQRRKQDISFDFELVKRLYDRYLTVQKEITKLEYQLDCVNQYLRENKEKLSKTQIEEKQQERRSLKTEVKKFDEFLLEFERDVILNVLKLPNVLDARTPLDVSEVIYESGVSGEPSLSEVNKHVTWRNKLDVTYVGQAAKFQYLFPIIVKNHFVSKHDFVNFSNTDICKGVIVEGVGTPYMCPYDNLLLTNMEYERDQLGYEEFRYHLVGSGHMSIFCAYHTNHSVSYKDLPVKYVSSGKRYGFYNLTEDIVAPDNTVADLYNCVQKEVVNFFIGTNDNENINREFDHMQTLLKQLFQSFNVRYRVCKLPAHRLHSSETFRLEYQVYSSCLNSWVTCGDVCLNSDYISKRLNMCFHKSVTSYEKQYLHCLNASIYVDVLLVNMLENGGLSQMNDFLAVKELREKEK